MSSSRDAAEPRPAPGGTAVCCVPGLGLGVEEWRPTARALRRHPDIAEVDVRALPAFGRRPSAGDDLRPASLGALLAADLVEQAVPEQAVLVGHSASSQVVVRAAVLAPERVSAVVLVGPTTDPRAATWPRLGVRWLRTAVWEDPRQVPLLARSYARTGLGGMRRAMEAARHEDIRVDLRAVRCPVLVVRGRHDRICPQDFVDELARIAPAGSAGVTLPRGAHMVPVTHGDLLAAAVTRFLA